MTRPEQATILVVAGEVSGDIHAANLVSAVRERAGRIRVVGIGGDRLAAEGLEPVARTEQLSHMGLAEVVRELPSLRRILRAVVELARRERPAVAVLLDSPDFNLRLARRLSAIGVPVVLYISPQLWAWRRGRVRTVRRVAREVLCILPFEVEFYRDAGVAARFVGHPLVDDVARQGLLGGGASPAVGRLAILPGSRRMEVRALLPAALGALGSLTPDLVDEVLLIEAPGVGDAIDEVLERCEVDLRLRRVGGDARRRELGRAQLAWTASGTATLECALLDVPMIVGYRLHPVSYAIARRLVRVPHVGLVNLIAGHRLAPELIQGGWTPERLATATRALLRGGVADQREGLEVVRDRLGPPGASGRAAEAVLEHVASARR